MTAQNAYTIDLKAIRTEPVTLNFFLNKEFFSQIPQGQIEDGTAEATVCVTPQHNSFKMEFSLNGKVTVACDRCLGALSKEVDAHDTLIAQWGEADEDEGEGTVIVAKGDGLYDAADFLYELIVLNLPMRLIHNENECDAAMEASLQKLSGDISDKELK